MSTISIVRNAVKEVNEADAFWLTWSGLKTEKNKRLSGATDARSLAYNLLTLVETISQDKKYQDHPMMESLVTFHTDHFEAKDKAKDTATSYADKVEALVQSEDLVTTILTEEAVNVSDRLEQGKDNLKTLDKALDMFTPFEGGIVWNLSPKGKNLARSYAIDGGKYLVKDGAIYGQREGDKSSRLLAKAGEWTKVDKAMPEAPKGAPKA